MRRYFRYIFLALILGILAMSCIEELDAPQIMQENEELTLVPRVKSFTNHYVTKSDYTGLETTIKKVSILVFDSDGKLVHLHEGSGESVIINKSMLNSSDTQTEKLKAARIVMFANMNLSDIKKGNWSIFQNQNEAGLTPEDLKNYVCNFVAENTVIPAPLTDDFEGFPMVGSKTLDLTSTTAKQDPVTVDLQILYAKINFSISVEAGTENEVYEGKNVSFALKQYSVHNASMATKLEDITASETAADAATESRNYAFSDGGTTITATGNQFTFYVAENRYNPYTGSKPDYPDYASLSEMGTIYPSDWLTPESELDVKDPAEDQPNGVKYFYDDKIQQYKPNLVTKAPAEAGKPTYVTLTGVYTDYRGTLWDVDYDIYLGKDNAHNFQVDRNSEYTNQITIKGIRNRQEGAYGEGEVWVDHRVDVSLNSDSPNKGADCVTITRETLIDSHIEVRPLRVSFTTSDYIAAAIYLPKYPLDAQGKIIYDDTTKPSSWGQVTEVKGDSNENWIAIENNEGKYNKGKLYCSNGKRKYFTTSLIEELHLDNNAEENGIITDNNGNKFIPLEDGECAWIYFDENGTVDRRRAQIDVVFYTSTGATKTETFDIYQSGLEEYGGIQFEAFEEYLHSYDSEDQYGLGTSPTDYTQQGLAWGILTDNNGDGILEGSTLSENYIVKSIAGGEDIVNDRYDYGHANDFPDYVTRVKNGQNWVNVDITKNTGLAFTARASAKANMTVMDMGTMPESAYQYCLSKNKFYEDPNGEDHEMIIRWYLPDVYEMKTILQYEGSADFNSGAYYWSSQPSYATSVLGIVSENDEYARMVSSESDVTVDSHRSNQHRIRCAYNKTGEEADMTDRVPDGLGGIIRIPMKAYETYPNSPGYFIDWIEPLNENVEDTPTLADYAFPKGGSDTETFDTFVYNGVTYYVKNPALSSSWSTSLLAQTLYYFPGLTTKDVVLDGTSYVESSNEKQYTRKVSHEVGKKIASLPTNDKLAQVPLDHIYGTNTMTISFANGTNQSKAPSYSYRKEEAVTDTTFTRKWVVPTYEGPKTVNASSGSVITKVNVGLTTYSRYSVNQDYVHEGITYKITKKYHEGNIFSRKYYFDLGPTTINKTGYTYKVNTGGWGGETKSYSPGDLDPVIDKLEIYGGNSFTITAKSGYFIQSIKVNYSGSNSVHTSTLTGGDGGASDNRFLRLVETRPTTSNEPPKNMSYSGDGDTGWFKWAAASDNENVSSVTLNLVTYTVTESFGLGGVSWWDSSFSYIEPADATGYKSDFNTSIIIDSFEIRIAEIKNNN